MALQPQQERELNTRNENFMVFLRRKILSLLPPMWRGNDADMPLLTREQIWFLRESRFLFFTRSGPVEITLKPTVVLATTLVGLVGISVIFLSTIFASYSAIEVIRDESIQTAQASIELENYHALSNLATSAVSDHETSNQGKEIIHKNPHEDGTALTGKTFNRPKHDISRTDTKSQSNAPGVGEPVTETTQITGSFTVTATPKSEVIKRPNQIPDNTTHQSVVKIDKTGMINSISPELSETNRVETSLAPDNNDSFAQSAAGFAIAMLPRFLGDVDTPSKQTTDLDAAELSDDENKLNETLDDGFAISAYSGKNGPLLPTISEPARAKKMLLSLHNEINYIRKIIRKLGIKSEHLPEYIGTHRETAETDFKKLLVTLAEHRAALRKIPFKTPMLYFYISSDYGYRKHPKTGLRTFHHGIDLAGTWQENVRATAPGTVVFAAREGSFGKVVRIEHEYGISTLYAHLARITVNVGSYVDENAVIGKMGNTGRSAGAHLHYEIQVNGQSVNPSDFFTIGRQMSVAGELRQSTLID